MLKNSIQSWRSRLPVMLLLATFMLFTSGCSDKKSQDVQQTMSPESPAAPVVKQDLMPPANEAGDTDLAAGELVYKKACMACHAAGIAGAPKLGDQAAWTPRIARGDDAMLESVLKGLNAMPPKGGCMSCSDQELRDALAYLVSNSS